MPNNLTALAPRLYSAAQTVSAEPFGVIRSINTSFDDKGVAIGDSVDVPVAPTRAAEDFVPGSDSGSGGADLTADGVKVQITASKKVPWTLTSEQIRSLQNAGANTEWADQLIKQGMRTLRNMAEADAALAIKLGASRFIGTAGTTPFGSTINELAQLRKALQDNGAPLADLQFACDTSAGLNLRQLGVIQNAYQAGSDIERRTGELQRQFGFAITESAGIRQHVKGTGASYVTSGTAAAGATGLTLATGTGTVLPGDVLAFAGDANRYVVGSGLSAPGSLTLNRPGLRAALASGVAATVGNNYVANVGFERNAVVGVMRPPLMPDNPTMTMLPISDTSGMTYLLVQIAQYGQIKWELHLAWGFKVVQPEHVAILAG